MADMSADKITVLEGLESARLRPAQHIGADDQHQSPRANVLELAVTDIAWEWQPQEVRILLWRDNAVTIAYDGRPLPIERCARSIDDVPHPALYDSFMVLPTPGPNEMAILNALSEQLVVSPVPEGFLQRHDCVAAALRPLPPSSPGATWLTYRADATIIAGQLLAPDDVDSIAERVGLKTECVRIRVEDRMTEDVQWY